MALLSSGQLRSRCVGLAWSWLYAIVGYAVGLWGCPGHVFTQLLVTQSVRGVDLVVALRSCRLHSLFVGLAWSWLYAVVGSVMQSVCGVGLIVDLRSGRYAVGSLGWPDRGFTQ